MENKIKFSDEDIQKELDRIEKQRVYKKAHREANKEAYKLANQKWRANNKEAYDASQAKYKLKQSEKRKLMKVQIAEMKHMEMIKDGTITVREETSIQ